ncbi:membrane protein [Spirochaetia bacterium]|nr:membrane protein [Spirochaetia bacterium]
MSRIPGLISGLISVYSFLIMVRIILTWFSRSNYGRPQEFLVRITDPYLAWFRRFPALRTPTLDFSPIVALAALSLAGRIFYIIGITGRISLGTILAVILSGAWSAVSFLLGFFILALLLRLAASFFNFGTFFRNIIDTISRPVLYRVTRIFFRRRLVNYRTAIIMALVFLAAIYFLGSALVNLAVPLLVRLPV